MHRSQSIRSPSSSSRKRIALRGNARFRPHLDRNARVPASRAGADKARRLGVGGREGSGAGRARRHGRAFWRQDAVMHRSQSIRSTSRDGFAVTPRPVRASRGAVVGHCRAFSVVFSPLCYIRARAHEASMRQVLERAGARRSSGHAFLANASRPTRPSLSRRCGGTLSGLLRRLLSSLARRMQSSPPKSR
jgi:hypothetical protein